MRTEHLKRYGGSQNHVFRVMLGGTAWVGATDGHAMLLLQRRTSYPVYPKIQAEIAKWNYSVSRGVSYPALVAWANEETGETNARTRGGTWVQESEFSSGLVLGVPVERRKLARYLEPVKAHELRVSVAKHDEPVLFDAGAWRLYLMPWTIKPGEDLPKARLEVYA